MASSRRPSAALVLGALSGCVAAVAVLPTAIPLTDRLAAAEEALALRQAASAADLVGRMVDEGASLQPGTAMRVGAAFVRVTARDGLLVHQEGGGLTDDVIADACGTPANAVAVVAADGREWAIACHRRADDTIVAGFAPEYGSTAQVMYLVVTLAAIVGIVTSLGVLRLLNPLSRMSKALVRVGAGERGVRVRATGLVELDELVDRLNAAARAMEDREDAIMARIQAVQEMARMVAHEVRNPLQSLELLTSLIASENEPQERYALAQAIHAEIRTLDMVVNRVLREGATRAAPRLPLHRAPQALAPLVDQVIALRLPEARAHGITLEKGPVTDRVVRIDAALVGRSIENLVLNALQAVPRRGGTVRVTVVDTDDGVAIIVEDNGPGVDPALSEHIFEPNVTGRTGGTGLGLALVKEVITAHRGTIVHDRSEMGGARFTARLPFGEDEDGEQPEAQDPRGR